MADETDKASAMISFQSSRFGKLEVPADSVIEFPSGVIGFCSAGRSVG